MQVLLTVAVVALALSALAAVAGVLRPMGHKDLDDKQIDAYSNRPKVITDPEDLRMTWLRTLSEITISDRRAGTWKARFLTLAVLLLVVGLAGVAGQALTLVYWNG